MSQHISLLTITYNEEKIIREFLNHYSFCETITIYDNLSTDRTLDIIKEVRPDATIIEFDTSNIIDNHKFQDIKNNAWKKNKDNVDWQIVVDCDEFLYNPIKKDSIPFYLSMCRNRNISLIPTVGWDMHFDSRTEEFSKIIPDVSFSYMYGKLCIFNPKRVSEIGYHIGAHQCDPKGDISITTPHLFLLHYRFWGYEEWKKRNKMYALRSGRIPGAFHYLYYEDIIKSEEDFKREFELNRMNIPQLFELKGTRIK